MKSPGRTEVLCLLLRLYNYEKDPDNAVKKQRIDRCVPEGIGTKQFAEWKKLTWSLLRTEWGPER